MITSVQNQRVKDAIKLRGRRQREKQGRFLIDGARELGHAITAGIELVEIFACREHCESGDARSVLARLEAAGATMENVTQEVFAKLAFGDRAEGLLAVARTPSDDLASLRLGPQPLVAVVEAIEKPGNLGAVLRSADAAGVSAVIAAGGGTDLYNPNVIRASLGTLFTLPVRSAASAALLQWLRELGLPIYTARVDAAQLYTDVSFASPCAIVLGNEAGGLSSVWNAAGITAIKIPMHGAADSLNIAAAAAVLFYEALRQRSQ
ncbi:MAG TPA: TrmH family RNA methyltransferase [Pirellulales bacterium]|jgi:TrmH family RNA methyltransferase|nr:TrmH family RNA methyltransferase [Pirellulales bacterium]